MPPRGKDTSQTPRGGNRLVAQNRKAYHDYFVDETLEAGMVLVGSEIKSIRLGRVSLQDAYVMFRSGEAWLVGCHISGYAQASYQDHDPLRERKLLLHRREILRWRARAEQRGYTIVPLRLYLKNDRAKLEIALVRGKRLYDKRAAVEKRESDRDLQRMLKSANRDYRDE